MSITEKKFQKLLTKNNFNVIIICRIKMAFFKCVNFRVKTRILPPLFSETYMKERCFSCLQ